MLAAPVVNGVGGSPPAADLDRLEVERFTATDDGDWISDELPVTDVVLVGAATATDAPLEVRAHDGERWGPWLAFPAIHDHGPPQADRPLDREHDHEHDHDVHHTDHDAHHTDHGHHGHHDHGGVGSGGDDADLDPLWVGPSQRLQLRVRGERPTQVTVDTVAMPPGQMSANRPRAPGRGAALAASGDPAIIPRDAWDPDGECRPADDPEPGQVRMAHIHHTVMYPTYTEEEADDVVRALCLFHVEARGFDDLGYNFMVDAYGRIYEGRAGGIDRAVVGSHAAGFNHVSAGISVMGDHETDPVPDATIDAITQLLAWLFTIHDVDPLGTVVVESTGGAAPGLTPFAEGETVELPTIVGHRDTGSGTLCPGRHLYEALEDVPPRVAELVLAARPHVDPAGEPDDDQVVSIDAAGGSATDAASAPTLPVTGWDGLVVSLLVLAGALIVRGRRRWDPRPTSQ